MASLLEEAWRQLVWSEALNGTNRQMRDNSLGILHSASPRPSPTPRAHTFCHSLFVPSLDSKLLGISAPPPPQVLPILFLCSARMGTPYLLV